MTKKPPNSAPRECGLLQALLLLAEQREPTSEEGFGVVAEHHEIPSIKTQIELVAALRDGRVVATGRITKKGTHPRSLLEKADVQSRCEIPGQLWYLEGIDFRQSAFRAFNEQRDWGAEYNDVRVQVETARALRTSPPQNDRWEHRGSSGRPKKVKDDDLYLQFIAMLHEHIEAQKASDEAGFPHLAEAVRRLAGNGLEEAQLKVRLKPIYEYLRSRDGN